MNPAADRPDLVEALVSIGLTATDAKRVLRAMARAEEQRTKTTASKPAGWHSRMLGFAKASPIDRRAHAVAVVCQSFGAPAAAALFEENGLRDPERARAMLNAVADRRGMVGPTGMSALRLNILAAAIYRGGKYAHK